MQPEAGETAAPSRREWTPLLIAYLVLSALYAIYSLQRHGRFETGGLDLGLFDQAVWRWSRFLSPENTIRRVPTLLADHFSPVMMLLVPVRWLGFDERGLLVVQPFIACAGAFPIFSFARRRLPRTDALLVAGAFLISWGLLQGLGFEIHEVAFTALFLPLAVDAFDRKAVWSFWIFLALWLLTKEDQGFAIAGLGLVAMAQRRWPLAAGLGAIGIGWVLLATRVLIPHFAGGTYNYWLYGYLGATPSAVLLYCLTHPVVFAKSVFTPLVKTKTLLQLLGGYAFAPLFSPYALLLVLPTLEHLLTDWPPSWSGRFQYWMPISAAAALAAADGWARLRRRSEASGRPALLGHRRSALVLLAASLVASVVAAVPQRGLLKPSNWSEPGIGREGREILALIPPDASVSATQQALGHLGARRSVYLLRYGWWHGRAYPPIRARYVVVDPILFAAGGKREDVHPFNDPEYRLLRRVGDWSLFRLRDDLPDARGFYPVPPGLKTLGAEMIFDQRANY